MGANEFKQEFKSLPGSGHLSSVGEATGSIRQDASGSYFPWLGSLWAISTNNSKDSRFISSVTLLSASTKYFPGVPAIIVTAGSIFDPFSAVSKTQKGKVAVYESNVMNQEDFQKLGFRLEVRFGDHKITKIDKNEVRLPVRSLIQHPYFAGVECKV